MSGESPAARVRGLVKSCGPVRTVRGIDLDIWHGEVFGRLLLAVRFFSWEPRQG